MTSCEEAITILRVRAKTNINVYGFKKKNQKAFILVQVAAEKFFCENHKSLNIQNDESKIENKNFFFKVAILLEYEIKRYFCN